MRAGLSILGLLVVLALVAVMTRKSLDSTRAAVPALHTAPIAGGAQPATVREQSQQIQQQYRQALDKALNQPRPDPAD